MARLRSTASSQQPAKTATAGRQALKEKTNTSRAKAPAYRDQDDENMEALVKDKKAKRGRPRKSIQESDELIMAGGLGSVGDVPSQLSEQPTATDELAKSDGIPPPTAKPNRRPARTVRKVVQTEAQSKVMEGLKQRMEQTARGQRAKKVPAPAPATTDTATTSSDTITAKVTAAEKPQQAVAERSEFSLSPSPPPAGKLSAIRGPRSSMAVPPSVLKAQSTPALETSILALKNFKRRPRQPSMLQMVKNRTASARPSLANTAIEATAVDDSSVFDLGLSDDGEDDFAPEAEGTPLHAAKTRRISSKSMRQPVSAESANARIVPKTGTKKRKSDEANISSGSLRALKAKRRKAVEDDQNEDEEPPRRAQKHAVQSSSQRTETPQPPITSDVQVINSQSTSTPPTDPPSSSRYHTAKEDDFAVPSTEREQDEIPEDGSDASDEDPDVNGTMADPLSSSPARPEAVINAHDPDDPIMADPLSQFTQDSEVVAKPKPKKKCKPVFTSTLQSLLPKRRQPLRQRGRKSEYDVDSGSDEDTPVDLSYLEEDEDELGAVRRRTKNVAAKTPKPTAAKRSRQSKVTSTAARKSVAPLRRTTSTAPGAKKVYGRATTSDKENEDYESEEDSTLPEVSLSMEEVAQSKEIEQAKNKFAEVDDWDMEFESMSQEFHRSSSQEWR